MLSATAITTLYTHLILCVVKIWVYNSQQKYYDWEGAGVFIDQQGYVLTVFHFLENESPLVKIECSSGREYTNIRIVKRKAKWGLVILKIEEEEIDFAHALVSENNLALGEQIFSIGHPFYMDFTYSIGQVAHTRREYRYLLTMDRSEEDEKRKIIDDEFDMSGSFIRRTADFKYLKHLSKKLSFVQFNNIHGDSLGGSSRSPVFYSEGKMIVLYLFEANDLAFGIHVDIIRLFIDKVMKK